IWEYRLNFSDAQVRRLLMHAWELGNSYFDYFFFKENCSYHLLSLLEYADPNLHLTEQFIFWTVPAHTVRLVVAQPGLVGDVAYRPSRSTLIRRNREFLSSQEFGLMKGIVRDVTVTESEEFKHLPINRQAFVLDVASDYLRYKIETNESEAATYKERNRTVLTARSGLKVQSEDLKIAPFAQGPELGHKTSRAGLGVGWRNGELGAAVESHLLGREVYFAFAEAEANVSNAYDENHRIGGGGTVGVLANLTDRWKVMLSTSYLRFPLGEQSDDVRFFFGQRYTLQQDLVLRFEFNHRDRDDDALFTVQAFF